MQLQELTFGGGLAKMRIPNRTVSGVYSSLEVSTCSTLECCTSTVANVYSWDVSPEIMEPGSISASAHVHSLNVFSRVFQFTVKVSVPKYAHLFLHPNPDLEELRTAFSRKYEMSPLPLIWVSIDSTPNRMYRSSEWWRHFAKEYSRGNRYKKELLVEMLKEKLSGEKPNSRHIKWL